MSVNVNVNGSTFVVPQQGDNFAWGTGLGGTPGVTALLQALSNYTLQPTGGTFTLTNDVDFGGAHGFKGLNLFELKSNTSAIVGDAGSVRTRSNSGVFQLSQNAGSWEDAKDKISVIQYGAIGDGSADNYTAFFNAEAAAYAANKPLYIPAGTYRLGTQLTSRVSIYGAGHLVTVLKIDHADATTDGIVFSGAAKLVTKGVQLLGASAATVRDLLSQQNCQQMVCEEVFTNVCGRYGIRVFQGLDCSFKDCRADNATTAGLYVEPNSPNICTTLDFQRCYFTNSTHGHGASIAGNQINFSRCIFESNGGADHTTGKGLEIRSGVVGVDRCYFENNSQWDIDAGTDGTGTCNLMVINPNVVGGSYKQSGRYGFHFGYVKGGGTFGGNLAQAYSTSIVMDSTTENHVIFGVTVTADPTWDLTGGHNLGDYNGLVCYRDSNTGLQKTLGLGFFGNLTVAATAITSGPYTLDGTTGILLVNAASASVVVNLPTAGNYAGRIYGVVKTDSSANTVTVTPAGGNTIDGASTFVLAKQNEAWFGQSRGSTLWSSLGIMNGGTQNIGGSKTFRNDVYVLAPVHATEFMSDATGAALSIQSNNAASGSAKNVVIDTQANTYGAGDSLFSVANHGATRLNVEYDGSLGVGSNIHAQGSTSLAVQGNNTSSGSASNVVVDTSGNTFTYGDRVLRVSNAGVPKLDVGHNGKLNFPQGNADSICGTAVLSTGTATVTTSAVRTGSLIFLAYRGATINPGRLSSGTITDKTSFAINSDSATDASTVQWWITSE